MGSLAGTREIRTFKLLEQMLDIMGTTKTSFFPMLESNEDEVKAYKESSHTLTATSGGPGFDAYRHVGGVNSLLFDATNSMYLLGPDHADFEFGNGTIDAAFSVGMWILPYDITNVTLMAKYDVGGIDREWKIELSGTSKIEIALFDEDADRTEIGASSTAVTTDVWTFVVVTYDGDETDPAVAYYQNAAIDGNTTTAETNSYVAMEAGATPFTIGAHLSSSVPQQPFDGRVALPFVCGKELIQAEVTMLYNMGRTLLGV